MDMPPMLDASSDPLPFQHWIIEGVLSATPEMVTAAAQAFPKDTCTDMQTMPQAVLEVMLPMMTNEFAKELGELLGMDGLVPDHWDFKLEAMRRWESVRPYLERTHAQNGMERAAVMIVFLNELWPEEWGGGLELWSLKPPGPVKTIFPHLGRTVILTNGWDSYHGVSPISPRATMSRNTLAIFYLRPDSGGPRREKALFIPVRETVNNA